MSDHGTMLEGALLLAVVSVVSVVSAALRSCSFFESGCDDGSCGAAIDAGSPVTLEAASD